jgi:hypothetical protein
MKIFRIITALSICLAVAVTGLSSNISFAKSSKKDSKIKSSSVSKSLISKANKYVKFDGKKFVFENNNKSKLTVSELNIVTKNVANANASINKMLSESKNKSDITYTTTQNGIKFTSYSNESSSKSGLQYRSINKSAMWDFEINWWGMRVFLHRNFIAKMKVYKDTHMYLIAGSAAGTTAILTAAGMATAPATALGLAVGAVGTYKYNKIEDAGSKGKGIYIDGLGFDWPSFVLSKIYPA